MKHRYLPALALAACACAAQANTGVAHAKLTNLTLTAFDVTPADGLTPSFEILQNQGLTFADAYIASNPNLPAFAQGFFAPLSHTSIGNNQVSTANIDATGFDVSTTAHGFDYELGATASSDDAGSGGFSHIINIRLAPGTGLKVSGNVALAVANHCDAQLAGTCSSRAGISANFYLGDFASATPYSAFITTGLDNATKSDVFNGRLSATYVNTTDHFQDLSLAVTGSVGTISPVDEPAMLGIVMAGLLSVGVVRKAQARLAKSRQA